MTQIFILFFYYGLVPAAAIWTLLLALLLHIYSVKCLVFLSSGSFSLVGTSGLVSLVPALFELIAGIVLCIVSSGLYLLYRYVLLERGMASKGLEQHEVELAHLIPSSDESPPVLGGE